MTKPSLASPSLEADESERRRRRRRRRRVKIDLSEARLVVRLVLSGHNKGRSIWLATTIYCATGPDELHIPPVSLTYHGVTRYTTTSILHCGYIGKYFSF